MLKTLGYSLFLSDVERVGIPTLPLDDKEILYLCMCVYRTPLSFLK